MTNANSRSVGVVAQREQVRVRALDGVDQVDLRGREILDHELRRPRAAAAIALLLRRVALGIEREPQPQIARRERRLGQREVRGRIAPAGSSTTTVTRRRAAELGERDR